MIGCWVLGVVVMCWLGVLRFNLLVLGRVGRVVFVFGFGLVFGGWL